MKPQKGTASHVSKLEKVLPIKGLRLSEDIHADLKKFASASGRTMTQQVRHYVIQSVLAEREGIRGMGEVSDQMKRLLKENEEIRTQLKELMDRLATQGIQQTLPKDLPEKN